MPRNSKAKLYFDFRVGGMLGRPLVVDDRKTMPDFSECFRISEAYCFVDWDAVDEIIARQGAKDDSGSSSATLLVSGWLGWRMPRVKLLRF
ncbi:MAG: hypothetical protein ACJAVK_002140 [Akkermansiaceae bacterium]|jgi:hypothetical protein